MAVKIQFLSQFPDPACVFTATDVRSCRPGPQTVLPWTAINAAPFVCPGMGRIIVLLVTNFRALVGSFQLACTPSAPSSGESLTRCGKRETWRDGEAHCPLKVLRALCKCIRDWVQKLSQV